MSHSPQHHARIPHRALLGAGPGIVLTLLVPKCPLCVAALLTSLGLGSALASQLAPWLHAAWFGIGCAAIASPLAVWLLFRLRASRARERCACGPRRLESEERS